MANKTPYALPTKSKYRKKDMKIINVEADLSTWNDNKEENIHGCRKHLTRWNEEAMVLKGLAEQEYMLANWQLREKGKVPVDPENNENLWDVEHHRVHTSLLKGFIKQGRDLGIDATANDDRYKKGTGKLTREEVIRIQLLQHDLREFIKCSKELHAQLIDNKMSQSNKTFAKEAYAAALKEIDDDFDKEMADFNAKSDDAFLPNANDREVNAAAKALEGVTIGATGQEHGEVQPGDDLTEDPPAGSAPIIETPAAALALEEGEEEETKTSSEILDTTPATPPSTVNTNRRMFATTPEPRTLLGLNSRMSTTQAISAVGVSVVQPKGTKSSVATPLMTSIQCRPLNTLLDAKAIEKWLADIATMPDDTPSTGFLPFIAPKVKENLDFMGILDESWKNWRKFPLLEFKDRLDKNFVKPQEDKYVSNFAEAMNGTTFRLDAKNLSMAALVESSRLWREKLKTFDDHVKQLESTPKGRNQLLDGVMSRILIRGIYNTESGGKPNPWAVETTPEQEGTSKLRARVQETLKQKMALPPSHPDYVGTGEKFISTAIVN